MLKRLTFLAPFSLLALAACSSSSSGGDSPPATQAPGEAFAKYCTGTLQSQPVLMKSAGAGAWGGDGKLNASTDTVFLLSSSFGKWGGYVILADGTPAEIEADFSKGLVKGTDFTSDCAPAMPPSAHGIVVLGPSKVYPRQDLTGTVCELDAGTELTNYGFQSLGGTSAIIFADELTKICGYIQGYSNDLTYGELVPRLAESSDSPGIVRYRGVGH